MSFAAFGMGALNTLVENSSNAWGTGKRARNKQQQEEHELFLRREKEGIISRVEGAKAAGLHPLVAMGYQAGPGPSYQIGTPTTSGYVDPPPPEVQPREAPDENITRYNAARARLAEAQATQAERDLDASQRRLAAQPGQPTPLVDTNPANRRNPNVRVKPNDIPAGSGGVEAGIHPSFATVEVLPDRTLKVPSGKLKEALEDNAFLSTVVTAIANRHSLGSYFSQDIPAALGFTGPRIKLSARPEYSPDYSDALRRSRKRPYRPGSTGSW